MIGFGVVMPLLPFYAHVFDAPAWQVTAMFSTFSLGQFAGEAFWGRLSDKIGRRPVLMITVLVSAVGYVALAFAPTIWIAIATRLFAGFFAGNISTIQGYVADVTPPEQRAGRLGLVGAAFGFGFIVGPSLGGLLARPELGEAGFRPPLLSAAGLCLLAGLGLFLFVRESQSAHHRAMARPGPAAALKDALAHPVLRRLLATTLLAFVAFSANQASFGLWCQARFHWGPKEIGIVSAVTGAAVALSQGVIAGRAARRFGEVATLMTGLGVTGVTLVIMAFSPSLGLAMACMLLTALGFSICQPATTSLISRNTKAEHQGAMLGLNAAVGALARISGPTLTGWSFDAVSPAAPFVFAGVGMIPAVWMAMRAGDAIRKHRARI
jgi:MFS family permease